MDIRTAVISVAVLAGVVLFAAHDLVQESGLHFADLAGSAHVRVQGPFSADEVAAIRARPDVAAAECDEQLYGVSVAGQREGTAVTATGDTAMRSFALQEGRMPAGAAEMLLVGGGARVGDRVELRREGRVVAGTVVGIASRPAVRAVGAREPVALLATAGMAALGGDGCPHVLVRLHDERGVLGFAAAFPAGRDVAFADRVRDAI
ncbi:hypothetical protein [Dactylosporangium sp. CS-033363]|uniref:hypothetical protein n=1 Tax=Dactylosporangium sp. CS-033363 TaxID=3239935 RepID=UPI003D92B45C